MLATEKVLPLLRSSSLLLGVNVVVGLLIFFTGAYVVQEFGETNRGLVAYVIGLGPVLAALGGLGSTNAIVFFDGRGEPVAKTFMIRVMKVVGMALAAVAAFHSLGLYFLSDENRYFVFAMLVVPISAYLIIQIKTWSLAKDGILFYFCASLIQPLILLLSVHFASTESFATIFSTVLAAECLAVMGLYLFFLRKKIPAQSATDGQRFIDYSKKNYASNLATSVYARADVMVISFLLGFQNLGLFVIANSIAAQLNLVASSINSLLFGYFMRSDEARSKSVFLKILVYFVIILAPIFFAIWYFGPYILNIIFGDSYSHLSGLLNIVLVSTLVYCLSQPFNAKFLSEGMVGYNTKSMSISFVVFISLSFFFHGSFGLVGVAYSLLAANVSLVVSRIFFFLRLTS